MLRCFNSILIYLLIVLIGGYSSICAKSTSVFSHGLFDNARQFYNYVKKYRWLGREYSNDRYILFEPVKSFNFPDVFICKPFVKIWKTSFGQKNEKDALNTTVQEVISEEDDEDTGILLFGLSRGGTVAINYMAHEDPHEVKALVLESPVSNAKIIFNHHWFVKCIAKWLCITPDTVYTLFTRISQHDANGVHAIDVIDKIRKNLPIMIICSEEDQSVPVDSVIDLYKKLKESGHKEAYLLKLKKGRHAKLLFSEEGEQYQNVMHAFYKKYGFPHDDELAEQGQALFELCQPSDEEL